MKTMTNYEKTLLIPGTSGRSTETVVKPGNNPRIGVVVQRRAGR